MWELESDRQTSMVDAGGRSPTASMGFATGAQREAPARRGSTGRRCAGVALEGKLLRGRLQARRIVVADGVDAR